jgi:glycosyltransferase involved in cell wall biosynthesis
LDQPCLDPEDVYEKRIIFTEMDFVRKLPELVTSLPKWEAIHYFSEEPELDKLTIFNAVSNDLYITMYRRPTEEYAYFLKEFKNLVRVYVELGAHKDLLLRFGIDSEKIIVAPPPSIFERSFLEKEFSGKFVFASWNGGSETALRERGLVAILDVLTANPGTECNILLRDKETEAYEKLIHKRGLDDKIMLSHTVLYQDVKKAFLDADAVLFLMQKRLTKDVPNSIIEGFALGKPVLMTSVVDFANVVMDQGLGWVIRPGEMPDMNMVRATYKKKAQNAFQYSKNLTPETYINTVTDGYVNNI